MADDQSELIAAIQARDPSRVRRQLELKSIDVNQTFDGRLPLVEAVAAGAEFVEMLLGAGSEVDRRDAKDYTPLIKACELKDPSSARILLCAGANPNLFKGTAINALRLVVAWPPKKIGFLRELIQAGAEVNLPSRSRAGDPSGTALMEASRVGTVEAVRELMAAGADPNAQVVLGNALMKAAEEGHYEVVQILLAAGADPTVALPNEPSRLQEHAGKTAAEIAMMNGHRRVAELLSAGAKEYQLRRSGNLREAWRRLEAVLSKMNPPAFAALRSGATLEDLSLLASERGEPLPAAAQEFFEIHDGQRAVQSAAFISAGPESDKPFRLLALTEVAREWHVWNRLRLGGEFRDQRSQPDSGVRNDWFHAGWIPLTSNAEGDNHCLDLAPAPGGTSGQVILLRHDNPSRPLLAPSLAEWVDELAANLEKKK